MQDIFSKEEQDFFHTNGYLVIASLFNIDEVRALSQYSDELEAAPNVIGQVMKYYEDHNLTILNRIENFLPFHHELNALINSPRILQRLTLLFGDAPVLFKDKINYKKPGGSNFSAHQDNQAGWETYAKSFISMSIALDETTKDNGWLEIGVGNYQKKLIGKEWQPLTEKELIGFKFISVPQKPGDVVFFDGYVPHRSGYNCTDTPRRNLYITYNPISEGLHSTQYYIDKRKNYPPNFEREKNKEYTYKV